MALQFRKRAKTSEQLSKMKAESTAKFRDVYENQDMERSTIGSKQTMASRLILLTIGCILVFIGVWTLLSFLNFGIDDLFHRVPVIDVATHKVVETSTDGSGSDTRTDDGSGSGTGTGSDTGSEFGSGFSWEITTGSDPGTVSGEGTGSVTGSGQGSAAGSEGTEGTAGSGGSLTTGGGELSVPDYGTLQGLGYQAFLEKYFYISTEASGFVGREYTETATGNVYTAYEIMLLYDSLVKDYAAYQSHYGLSGGNAGIAGTGGTPGAGGTGSSGADVTGTGGQGSGQGQDGTGSGSGDGTGSTTGSGSQDGSQTGTGDGSGGSGSGSPVDVSSHPRGMRAARIGDYIFFFTWWKLLISLLAALIVFGVGYVALKKNLLAQNALDDTTDINQYEDDQHIQTPKELQENYDWFPDVGAHAPVQVSSMLSHMMLSNKGLKTVQLTRRAGSDVKDKDGEVVYFKGEALVDKDGEVIRDTKPMIDEKFGDALFDASGMTIKQFRIKYDPSQIIYNPGDKNRDKMKGAETVADLINKYWSIPEYEPQRPAGAYIVDTAPVNTMILAITRAGKGQTYIEPVLDMWTREDKANNMVINDPKGELLVKFYVRGAVRGYQIVQFNLINAMKTDIYNPLGLAAESAREGDFTKAAAYVENIAEVFFPLEGADDPLWPTAANNAFKRAAYGLIDYYLEEEKELRALAERVGMDDKTLENQLDTMWGKVTLYNCYQLFVQLTAKKLKNPVVDFKARSKKGDFDPLQPTEDPNNLPPDRQPMTDDEYEEMKQSVFQDAALWEEKPEADLLTLFFNATKKLPRNQMRVLIQNADDSLRAMSGAEKMLSSVYGIAITAMSFFTDPTVSTLTSGTPSQNVDLGGLSFPRRLGVRFNTDYVKKYSLMGMQCRWMSFEDKQFEKDMGKAFYHEDTVSREGWAMYYFEGKYPKDVAYIRLQLVNPVSGMIIKTFYFEFRKSYQMSLDARYYVEDPVLHEKIVKNGILTELRQGKTGTGKIQYKRASTTFPQERVRDVLFDPVKETQQVKAIIRTMVRYSEKPKMVFLVTPPHLMKYAKLILILIKQLVDLNFDKSYMTKSNQKP